MAMVVLVVILSLGLMLGVRDYRYRASRMKKTHNIILIPLTYKLFSLHIVHSNTIKESF